MLKILPLFICIFIITGCSSNITDNNSNSDDQLFKTKVIDGYISGANVYIDFNWNMTQDANEPSAYEDTIDEYYYWDSSDFSSINRVVSKPYFSLKTFSKSLASFTAFSKSSNFS